MVKKCTIQVNFKIISDEPKIMLTENSSNERFNHA